ncbi:MAG: glycerophosphodiester phosphodiesterase [Proteobacteria bacterium]|nr:glycerophosphodiester phosphodiesterase [Pseudomonadota bacterium]
MSPRARPLVIAHRGASGQRPENTPAAYELAVSQGADMIEIDLHRTRDGAVVITHDGELSGLGGDGAIADTDLAAVRALDAGDGQVVPTLTEVLDAFGKRVAFNLELKRAGRSDYEGLEALALAAVRDRGALGRTLFSSFYDSVLERLRALEDGARLAVLVSARHPERVIERARAVGAEAVNPHVLLADRDWIARAHDAGLAVYVYTVDDVATMERLLEWGVDGLFTNYPERLRALVDALPG